jgi:phosphoesterase RecJ-like protein
MDRIVEHLTHSRRVLVASHANPDGDAIGALIALGLALGSAGKSVTIYNESPIPAVYRFLGGVHRVVNRLEPACDYPTAVVLDCGSLERLGAAAGCIARAPVVINIDHHMTNTRFGTYRYIDAAASATSEIVYRLINKLGVAIDKDMATALYTGILTDTGSFRFSNTSRDAFAICEALIGCGADPYNVAQNVYGKYSLGRIKLLNLALDSIEITAGGKLSMMALTRDMFEETGTQPEDVDGMINYARRIEDVRVAVLIREHLNGVDLFRYPEGAKKAYHVSLRSDGTVDVAAIAAVYGGGGHLTAAGFNVESTLAELKDEIVGQIERK